MSGLLMTEEVAEPVSQQVVLNGRETPFTIHGYSVDIHPSPDSSLDSGAAGSSKVQITTITNQNWQLPKSRGTIVASNDQYLAYVLEGKSGYVLRVLQPETSNRALLKGFVGGVLDVAFAHRGSSLLAAVDEGGNVYVWDLSRVEEITKAPTDALCVVLQRGYESDKTPHRLVWSPHVGVEEGEECLVVSHGLDVEIIDVRAVIATVPSGMKIASNKLEKGITTLPAVHSLDVTDLSLSPDGQVLATCGEDGLLKFWSLSEKRCLHELNPHQGRLVTRLIFCDNHISQDPSNQFWRFLLTVSGTELKLWCTVSWKCLQTIRFCTTPSGSTPHILLNLDLSASYLVVTDAMRAAVYVMQLVADDSTGTASLTSLTEYLLKQPIFSFIVPGHASMLSVDVGVASSDSEDEDDESPQRDTRLNTVGIKLHTVHSKSMQELEIKFEPPDLTGVPPPDEPVGVADPLLPTTQPVGVADPLLPTTQPVGEADPLLPTTQPVGVADPLLPTTQPVGEADPLLPTTQPLGVADPLRPTTQPSSLPTFGAHSDLSTSFHSLTDTGSPKLLTPAQFLSPNKSDLLLPSPRDFETTPSKHSTSDLTSVTMETLSADEAQSKHTEMNSDLSNRQDDALLPEINNAPLEKSVYYLGSDDGSPNEVSTHMPHPLMSAHSQEVDPASSEFVNLPKSVVEVINDGTIVTASPMTTPAENLASFQKVNSLGDSPSPEPDAVEEEGEWPNIGQHDLPTKIISKDQDMSSLLLSTPSSVYSAPVVGGGASVYDSPFVGGGANMYDKPPVGAEYTFENDPVMNEEIVPPPEEPLVVKERISSSDSDSPFADKEKLIAVEETPAISQDPPPALVINEEVPPVMIEDAPVINNEPPLLHVVDSGTELTMPSGSIETTLEAFNTPKLDSPGESHDQVVQSHDQPAAGSSNEQLEVKHRSKSRRRRRKKKSTGAVNSESDREMSESVSSIESAGDLLAIVAKQQEEIVKLRREQEMFRSRLEGKLDTMMNQQAANIKDLVKQQDARLDRVLREKSSSDKIRADKLASTLTTSLSGAIKNKLDHLIKAEMRNTVLPSLQRSMTSIQNDLSANMAQRMEAALRDGVNQILHIGGLSDAIGGAVAGSLQRVVAARYEEVFKSVVIPGFEKGCQEMFRQIDEAFRRGTTEYLGQLSGHNRQLVEMTLQQVTHTVTSLAGQGSPLIAQVQSVVKQEMATTQQNLQQMVVESVASSVSKEVEAAFKEYYQASPEVRQEEERKRKEEEMTRLVGDQRFNSAFELALSTSDLKLVMYLCGQVNADFVFEKTPCPLSQPVLLSLIQQLSVELQDQLELKIKYLEHSLLALDVGSDVTRSHMTPVVSQLSQQLSLLEQTFMSNSSLATPTITKLVKRLKMMAQHLTAQQ